MYEAYWQLAAMPFENAADTRFFFPGETYQAALLKLRYAVENRRGAALLTGPAGSGKTLLVQALLRQLSEKCFPVVQLVFPQMPPDQLLAYLAEELQAASAAEGSGGPEIGPGRSIDQSVRRIQGVLAENARTGRHAVIVIDEAQILRDTKSLETMRLLLNFEHEASPNLTLLLVGQTSLLPVLSRMPELELRLAVKCLLRAFNPDETASYVNHRLAAAGARRPLFSSEALVALYELSQGIPRRINRLCDLALLIGYAEERTQIGRWQIEAVAEELLVVAEAA